MFRNISGNQNFCGYEGGGRQFDDFLSKHFCLTVPVLFVEEIVSVSKSFRKWNILGLRGEITIFDRNFDVSQFRKRP